MKMKYIVGFLLPFLAVTHAQAVIIDGEFTGVVKYQDDMSTKDSGYIPYWESNIVGEAIHGTFWYDTDLAPADSSDTPNRSLHTTVGNSAKEWVGIKIFIGGKMVDISHSIPTGLDILHREETVVFEDFEQPANWDNSENFSLADVSSASNSAGDYDYKWLTIRAWEKERNVVDGIDLEQEFSWVNINEREFVSLGLFNVRGFMNGEKFDASASLKLLSLSTSVRDSVRVPEPSSLLLFALGLFCLLARILMIDRRESRPLK
ncbi:MAG: hypothetical protein B0W54_09160 [Cellvibrio sp. 79]|nr:MAG: hypothetical protein B0W54_09160 [Cellvibrio sp. 79]